ncbi:MAG: hypothetical protein ACHQNE_07695, partial [Candidatus Kapaibacterium sp.]
MAERPQHPPSSDRASAMAARFGMTREAVEELLHQTHSEYPSAEASALPPAEPAAKTSIEQAAEKLPVNPEAVPPPAARPAAKPLGGGFIAAIFIVLLIALGVALSFRQGCFHRRNERQSAKPVDTIQMMMNSAAKQASSPPLPATNVPPGEVPPEALVVPREEPPGTSGPNSNSGITTEAQALQADQIPPLKPALVTSSNFEAEEELAQLRAGGKSHAYMKAVHRHGTISYRV